MSSSILRNRLLIPELCRPAAMWLERDLPLPEALRGRTSELLADLLRRQEMKGIVIERAEPDLTGETLVGLGLSAFIQTALMDRYVARPMPFVLLDLLQRADRGERCLAGPAQVARDNAGQGLHLVVHYLQRGWDFSVPLWRDVGLMGHQTYVEHHRGYHVQRVLQEDWTENKAIYLAAGYRELATVAIDGGQPRDAGMPPRMRTLFAADCRDIASRAPGSSVSFILERHLPRCGFPPSEQRLLEHALQDATDRELSVTLDLSPATIKSLWRQIYQRVQSTVPFVLPDEETQEDSRRGPEKRRRVLSFVRDHPHEIRPYSKSRVV